jgi:hypothetical protein
MPWTPTKQVIDLSPVVDNLLGYFEANDADALAWANGGDALPEFEKFYSNASGRLQTIFPSLMVLSQESETDLAGEVNVAGLQLTLEATITGSNADQLVADSKKYARAVESMLANIPSATLTDGCSPDHQSHLFEIETRLDILRGQANPSAFLQIFQTRCVYRLTAPAF